MLAHGPERVVDELGCYQPAELLLGGQAPEDPLLADALRTRVPCCAEVGDAALFDYDAAAAVVTAQFGQDLEALGLSEAPQVVQAAGALLTTLKQNQKSDLPHVRALEFSHAARFLELDLTARRNLELTETLRSGEKRGSLLWVLDKTKTALGGRLLRSWLEKPLVSPNLIQKRLDAVEELVNSTMGREELIRVLREVTDLERVMARIVTGTCTCRDFRQLAAGLAPLPALAAALGPFESAMLATLRDNLPDLTALVDEIDRAIVDEPPFTVREGGMIRPGYSEEIDRLHDIMSGGKDTLAEIEARRRSAPASRISGWAITGCSAIISRSRQGPGVPGARHLYPQADHHQRRALYHPGAQGAGGYHSHAKDRVVSLEYEAFQTIRQYLADHAPEVQAAASVVAAADVLSCFAALAVDRDYVRPEVDLSGQIVIEGGRHPVVEQVLRGQLFVPNDTKLGTADCQVAIITGPNMAGKSTYMRQVALIVLLAQMGSFVPARAARIGAVDRIFTRIGASDDLAAGQSTFMVEMQEVAEILRPGHAPEPADSRRDRPGHLHLRRHGHRPGGAGVRRRPADPGGEDALRHPLPRADGPGGGAGGREKLQYLGKEAGRRDDFPPEDRPRRRGPELRRRSGQAGGPAAEGSRPGPEAAEGAGGGRRGPSRPGAAPGRTRSLCWTWTPLEIRDKLKTVTVETMTPIEAMNLLYELKQMIR